MFFPRKLIISITSLFFMSLFTYVNILWIFYASFIFLFSACFPSHWLAGWLLPFCFLLSFILFIFFSFFLLKKSKAEDKHKTKTYEKWRWRQACKQTNRLFHLNCELFGELLIWKMSNFKVWNWVIEWINSNSLNINHKGNIRIIEVNFWS